MNRTAANLIYGLKPEPSDYTTFYIITIICALIAAVLLLVSKFKNTFIDLFIQTHFQSA